MDERLVYVGKVVSIDPIPGADFIVAATVVCGPGGKWRGVVRKADFEVGTPCVVCLPDALVPPNHPDLSFLSSTNWRVKMRIFKGAPSEVVIIPYTGFSAIGTDLTKEFGVTKYMKEIPAALAAIAKGDFPSFIPKTDEPNFQRSEELISELRGHAYYMTEKADGMSTTAFKWRGEFGVCSRNLELREDDGQSAYWKVANNYNLREKLPEGYALQWETCGPKIQSNPMGLNEIKGLAFSLFDISPQKYTTMDKFIEICEEIGFPRVRLLHVGESYDDPDLTELARGKYANGKDREGIVVRSCEYINGKIISFKSINLDYKD